MEDSHRDLDGGSRWVTYPIQQPSGGNDDLRGGTDCIAIGMETHRTASERVVHPTAAHTEKLDTVYTLSEESGGCWFLLQAANGSRVAISVAAQSNA